MKLALYARTSTDDQKTGLEAQERALREYLTYRKIPAESVLEFRDDGVSGTKRSRPGFDRMMAAVRSGEVKTVLVYSFSRFARNTRHLLDALEEFGERGVSFISLSEQIDTSSSVGKFLFTIFAALAQFERDQTAERVKNGLKNARAKGKRLGAPKRIKDEDIRKLKASGWLIPQIVRELGVSRRSVYRALKG